MSGDRGSLARDAFHHASISAQGVDVEVEQVLKARAVVTRSQPLPGNRHAHAGGDALAERSRCGLDARRPAVFRMSRAAAIHLAKCLDRLHRHRYFAKSFIVLADCSDLRQVKQ